MSRKLTSIDCIRSHFFLPGSYFHCVNIFVETSIGQVNMKTYPTASIAELTGTMVNPDSTLHSLLHPLCFETAVSSLHL